MPIVHARRYGVGIYPDVQIESSNTELTKASWLNKTNKYYVDNITYPAHDVPRRSRP